MIWVFQRLYDLEINFSVSCFWDGGFEVGLGDDMNGWRATGNVRTWEEVAPWLLANAMKFWPGCAAELKEGPTVDPKTEYVACRIEGHIDQMPAVLAAPDQLRRIRAQWIALAAVNAADEWDRQNKSSVDQDPERTNGA